MLVSDLPFSTKKGHESDSKIHNINEIQAQCLFVVCLKF